MVILLLVAPVANTLLQLALSRTREFDADLNAAQLTGDPRALARGLQKLERYNESMLKHVLVPGYGRPEPSILRTHPHTEQRVERLEELADHHDRRALDSEDDVRAHREIERVETGPRWRPLGVWY